MKASDFRAAQLTRRFILKGTGASLALPVLPSLLTPREAAAQSAKNARRYIHLATQHGGVWTKRMFPSPPKSGVRTRAYAGRQIRAFPTTLEVSNGTSRLSPVLSAPASAFTERLAQKMLVLQGLDVPFYLAHHSGGHLGNFARNDGNGGDGQLAQTAARRRTIDQIMAWSPSFYADLSGVRERVLVLGEGISYDHTNPAAGTGALQEIAQSAITPLALFDKLFPGGDAGPPSLLVDRVYASYQRLRDSGRLSAADHVRLEDHMQRVFELQRRMQAPTSCKVAKRPKDDPYAALSQGNVFHNPPHALDPAAHARYFQALTDVVVLALSCGVSRVAVLRVDLTFSTFSGDWHQDVAHQAGAVDAVRQGMLADAHQRFFAGVMVDLAQKLDAIDTGDGRTLLDQSLAVWTQECGNTVHNSDAIPVVTFGSAGGFLRTGQVCDFRHLDLLFNPGEPEKRHPGLLWQQWLGTTLEAMGVPRSEWEKRAVNLGYPDYKYAASHGPLSTAQAYPEAVWSAAGEVLPWIKA